jgi:hypothetical protein
LDLNQQVTVLSESLKVDLDYLLLLFHFFGPSEYRPFFSLSAFFEILGISFSIFLSAYEYSIQTLHLVTFDVILIAILSFE